MEVNDVLKLKRIYLNYYILCGEDKVIEGKPFICINAVSENSRVSSCLLNEKKVLEDLYKFMKPLDKSLIIVENPEEFVELFEERYKILFEKDCDLDLRKHIYYNMDLGVTISQALLFQGAISNFDENRFVDIVFSEDVSPISKYMKIRLIIMNRTFINLLKHFKTEKILFKTSIYRMSQTYEVDKDLFTKRITEITTEQKLLPTNKINKIKYEK